MAIPWVRRNFVPSSLLSDHSLSRKAYLNVVAAALDYAARVLVGLVITPFLVVGLGDYTYGAWRVLQLMVGYLSPASGRPTQALKWTIANQQSVADSDQKRRYVGSALAVWVAFLPILGTLGAFLAWFAPSWLKVPQELSLVIGLAAGLLVADLIVGTLVEVPRSVLEGENRGYKRMGLSVTLVVASGGLTYAALYLNTGMLGVAAATLVTTVLTGVLFFRIARTYVPWFGIAKPSRALARQFLGLSWWFLGWNLIMRLMTGSDVVLLGIMGSVESVTTYSLTKYAPETLINVIEIIVFGITPGLGGIIGAGHHAKAAQVRGEMMSLTWLIVTVVGSTILLWNWGFVQVWVGADHYAGTTSLLLIVVVVTQFIMLRNDANIIDLTLNLPMKVLIGALSVGLSLAVAGILVGYLRLGVAGLCLGFIAGRAILSVAYPLMVGRVLGVSFSSQVRGVLRPLATTGTLYLASSILSSLLMGASWYSHITWLTLVPSVGISVPLVLAVAFFVGLTGSQRSQVLHRVRTVVAVVPN